MKLQVGSLVALLGLNVACSAGGTKGGSDDGNGSGATGSGAMPNLGGSPNLGKGGDIALGGMVGAVGGGPTLQPETCEEAALGHTYVGCDFCPTITANPVYVEFDPAVVIANGSGT